MKMRSPGRAISLLVFLCGGLAITCFELKAASLLLLRGETNRVIETSFTAMQVYTDPFNDVSLDVIVTDPLGKERRVPAFWAGGQSWRFRYASPIAGRHRFKSVSSHMGDNGLHGITGEIEIQAYTGKNLLYLRGPLKVSATGRYLEYEDGTPFFWLGDTWWMGLCHRLRFPEDVAVLAADRKTKGFNVIQLVAGLYPDMHPFDPRGANEAGFPWEENYTRIRPEYFDAADRRIQYLVDEGFTPCIVGAWGYFLPWMGIEKAKAHWRYLIARYGALPVVWCVAGEANLPWYLEKGFPFDDRNQVAGWTEVTRAVRAMDPFKRLVTIHPTGIGRLSARNAIDDLSLIDFDMLQTPHSQRGAVAPTVRTVRQSYADSPTLPVINGEPAYEMLNDSLPTEWSRQMFWLCMMNGAMGHTYGANGIWQVNRRGQPHGASPHNPSGSTGYGVIAWNDAMNLPGSQHVAYGRQLFERFRWQDFQPHPEWAEFADNSPFDFSGAQWIWTSEGTPGKDAPSGKRWFRRTFELPEGKKIKRAQLFIAADGPFVSRLNKRSGGSGEGATTCMTFYDLSHLLTAGKNVVGIAAENLAKDGANPAGVIARLEITFENGEKQVIQTDTTWVSSGTEVKDWDNAAFDDSSWTKAITAAAYGEAPWGKIAQPNSNDIFGPQSTGLQEGPRLTYVPSAAAIRVKNLPTSARFKPEYFNPVTGKTTPGVEVKADDAGTAVVAPPSGHEGDWILIWGRKS